MTASPQLYKHFCVHTFVLNNFITFAGLAGSVLEERLNRTNTPHWYCATEVDDWQTVWLSLQSASRPDCLIDELQVFYDGSTGRCVLHSTAAFSPVWEALLSLQSFLELHVRQQCTTLDYLRSKRATRALQAGVSLMNFFASLVCCAVWIK